MLLNGWYAGRSVGSGRYTDELVAALRSAARGGDSFEITEPGRHRSITYKLMFEQAVFPWLSRAADVAHVPYWAPPLTPVTPTVVTIHDLIPLVLPEYRPGAKHRAYVDLVARASQRAAAVVTDSEHTAHDIRTHLELPDEMVHVVPLGVDSRFSPAAGDPGTVEASRAASDLPDRFGLYLGGFDKRKNLDTLVAAWRAVYRDAGLPLVVAGAPPRSDSPTKLHPATAAAHAGLPDEALMLVGHVPTEVLPDLYRRAAVFVYPSRYEGFGLPPLEAMACGVPVVAADATSLPEVVGDAGLLVDPDDVQAWSDSICRVVQDGDLARRLRESGLRRASTFRWDRTAAMTRDVYESVRRS